MRILIFTFFIFNILACNEASFKVNDCIQKPDESMSWKITQLQENEAALVQNSLTPAEILRTETLDSTWIKTKCVD